MRHLFVLARSSHMIIWNQVNLPVSLQAHIKHFVLSVGLGLLELRAIERFYWKHMSVKNLLLKLFIEHYGSLKEASAAEKELREHRMTATLNISPQTFFLLYFVKAIFLKFQIPTWQWDLISNLQSHVMKYSPYFCMFPFLRDWCMLVVWRVLFLSWLSVTASHGFSGINSQVLKTPQIPFSGFCFFVLSPKLLSVCPHLNLIYLEAIHLSPLNQYLLFLCLHKI